jgi:predicted ester cyclase
MDAPAQWSDADCVNAIRDAVAALNSGDITGYLDRFDPGCERWLVDALHPLALTDVADGLRQLQNGFDPLQLETEALFGADQRVCARWRLTGLHTGDFYGIAATGRAISMQQCEVYEFTGNRVTTVWTYLDPASIFRQLEQTGAP